MSSPAPAATIVPSSAGVNEEHPLWQGIKRILLPLLALAPFLLDGVIDAVSAGQLTIPDKYASTWAVVMLAITLYNKARLAQGRQTELGALKSEGLPTGVNFTPSLLEKALFTESKLPFRDKQNVPIVESPDSPPDPLPVTSTPVAKKPTTVKAVPKRKKP